MLAPKHIKKLLSCWWWLYWFIYVLSDFFFVLSSNVRRCLLNKAMEIFIFSWPPGQLPGTLKEGKIMLSSNY